MSTRTRTRRETSAGGVVVRCTEDGPRFLLILDGYGNWGFPKGHVNPGESPDAAARREISEETGLADLDLRAPLGVIDWHFRFRGTVVHKSCHLYLFESAAGHPAPQTAEGLVECAWLAPAAALSVVSFENARGILATAIHLVRPGCPDEG